MSGCQHLCRHSQVIWVASRWNSSPGYVRGNKYSSWGPVMLNKLRHLIRFLRQGADSFWCNVTHTRCYCEPETKQLLQLCLNLHFAYYTFTLERWTSFTIFFYKITNVLNINLNIKIIIHRLYLLPSQRVSSTMFPKPRLFLETW